MFWYQWESGQHFLEAHVTFPTLFPTIMAVPFSPRGGTSNLSSSLNRYYLKSSISRTGEGCISSVWYVTLQGQVAKFIFANRCKRRKEKSQRLLTRETLRKAYMKIFNFLVSFKDLYKWILWIEIQCRAEETVLPWESRWCSSIVRYFILLASTGLHSSTGEHDIRNRN